MIDVLSVQDIKNRITPESVRSFFSGLDISYVDGEDHLILRTYCHNPMGSECKEKLYFFFDGMTFTCFTECHDTFDLIEFCKRFLEQNGKASSFHDALRFLDNNLCGKTVVVETEDFSSILPKSRKASPVPKYILECFESELHSSWVGEDISKLVALDFGVGYSPCDNAVVVPHHSKTGELIGIRLRLLGDERPSKYVPLKYQKRFLSHRLSDHLYGLHKAADEIQRTGKAYIFEGEKSVLKMFSCGYKNAVACCGSNISSKQISLLHSKGCNEAVICFDKEFVSYGDADSEKYEKFLRKIAKKYEGIIKMSYKIDRLDKLGYKDSPIDRGIDIFKTIEEVVNN